MKKPANILALLFALSTYGLSSQAFASLMLETYASGVATPASVGGFTMTDFTPLPGSSVTSSISSPISGTLDFIDKNGDPLLLDQGPVSSATDANNVSWWENGESFDYDIFTTGQNWITMLLPEDTYAFSFNVGANKSASGWLKAEAYDGSVINKTSITLLGNDKAPGFAVYSDDSCSAIKSITVEPPFIWGVGNFSISQGNCTTDVPEPSILSLFAAGLLGIGLTRRRMKS